MRRSQQSELLPFDPEIERTLKVLKKKSREGELEIEMEGIPAFGAGNMGQDIDQEGNNGGNGGQVLQNEQRRRRTTRDYIRPSFSNTQFGLVAPPIEANNFKPDSVTIQMIRERLFNGFATEDPAAHLRNFVQICDNFKVNGVPPEVMRLRLFPFSLSGKARDWLDTIPSNAITTWDLLTEFFLDKFFPTARTERLIAEIQDFKQYPNETLYEAYERFTELLRKCPHHGLRLDQLLRSFYRGLNESSATILDTRAPESWILDMVPEEAFELIDKLTRYNHRSHERNERSAGTRQVSRVENEQFDQFSAQVATQLELMNWRLEQCTLNQQVPPQQSMLMMRHNETGEGSSAGMWQSSGQGEEVPEDVNYVANQEGKETSITIIQERGINKIMDGGTPNTQINSKIKTWVPLLQVLSLALTNSKYHHHHKRIRSRVLRRCFRCTWQVMRKSSNSNRPCCKAMDQPFSSTLLCCKIKGHPSGIWRHRWGRLLVH